MLNWRGSPEWGMRAAGQPASAPYRQPRAVTRGTKKPATAECYRRMTPSACGGAAVGVTASGFLTLCKKKPATAECYRCMTASPRRHGRGLAASAKSNSRLAQKRARKRDASSASNNVPTQAEPSSGTFFGVLRMKRLPNTLRRCRRFRRRRAAPMHRFPVRQTWHRCHVRSPHCAPVPAGISAGAVRHRTRTNWNELERTGRKAAGHFAARHPHSSPPLLTRRDCRPRTQPRRCVPDQHSPGASTTGCSTCPASTHTNRR
jgi:hypothetical protein